MAEMLHKILIKASREKVYEALTTPEGLRSWWTADVKAEPRVGGHLEFGFGRRATIFIMRVEELSPARRIEWRCLGDVPEWVDTSLTWTLAPKDGSTVLYFTHGEWKSTSGWFAECNSTWGELMYRLKDYLEGKSPGPHWTE